VSPFLSVVMPTYNGERFIAAALESVRSQYCDGIELVLVIDGSSDNTLEIVNRFSKDILIRVVTPGRIGNWTAVTNIGMREARGEWACFLHDDDLWLPGRIARIRSEMERAEGSLILHDAIFIGPDGRRLGPWTCPLPAGVVQPERFMEHLLVQNFIAICSPVFRRKAAVESGGLDEALWHSADWDLWLRLGAMGPVRFAAEPLGAFRVHPSSLTAARKLKPGEWEQQLSTVFNRHIPNWTAPEHRKRKVRRAASASLVVNSSLAAAYRGESGHLLEVVIRLLALGPLGWRRYLRDSRIIQRVWPRLKVQRLAKVSSTKKEGQE
jgi:glycosyltransferase involved in cell wall biosynthesis